LVGEILQGTISSMENYADKLCHSMVKRNWEKKLDGKIKSE
jgi:hypothetical protein